MKYIALFSIPEPTANKYIWESGLKKSIKGLISDIFLGKKPNYTLNKKISIVHDAAFGIFLKSGTYVSNIEHMLSELNMIFNDSLSLLSPKDVWARKDIMEVLGKEDMVIVLCPPTASRKIQLSMLELKEEENRKQIMFLSCIKVVSASDTT